MKDLFDIVKEINELTLKIEFQYPELYRNLEEIPIKAANDKSNSVDSHALYDYLINLKAILSAYEKNRLQLSYVKPLKTK